MKQYAYTIDDELAGLSYANAVNPTASVTLAYDTYYRRPIAMTDGTGTTTYAYKPVGSNGALQLASETSPLAFSSVTYGYDALGRISSKSVTGATSETYGYDAIGRMTNHVGGLGSFAYAYLGQTGQLTTKSLGGTSLASTWSYASNLQDRRLTAMTNTGLVAGQHVDFTVDTDVLGRLTGLSKDTDAPTPSHSVGVQTGQFNNLNQQTLQGSQALTYDAVGQLTSDGVRNYSWDAEGRLIGITYPGQTGKSTSFTYDGMGRRVGILSTPVGGGTSIDRRFVWCGDEVCQSRSPNGADQRDYLLEGEKTGAQSFYYAQDHQGSVRRAFTSTTSPAYDYDPYGTQMQSGPPVTDYSYAGLMALPEAGIYLSSTRPYNPGVGRWLRRDMAGEEADSDANLYGYADRDPINLIDPNGDSPLVAMAVSGALINGGINLGLQLYENQWDFSCVNWGSVGKDAAIGAVSGFAFGWAGQSVITANRSARITSALQRISYRSTPTGIKANQVAGASREAIVRAELALKYPGSNIQNEVYLRASNGKRFIDPLTGAARRIDSVVITNGVVVDSVEVTSMNASKASQIAKEMRIRNGGGTFIKDRISGGLMDISGVSTRIVRNP